MLEMPNSNNSAKATRIYMDCVASKKPITCYNCAKPYQSMVSIFDSDCDPIIVCERCVLFFIADGIAEVLDN